MPWYPFDRRTGAVGCAACCLPAASQPGNLDGWASRAFLRLDAAWLGSIERWASSWNDPRQALLPIGSSWVCPTTQVSSCGGVDTGLAAPYIRGSLPLGGLKGRRPSVRTLQRMAVTDLSMAWVHLCKT
jgi:hypothetical protein